MSEQQLSKRRRRVTRFRVHDSEVTEDVLRVLETIKGAHRLTKRFSGWSVPILYEASVRQAMNGLDETCEHDKPISGSRNEDSTPQRYEWDVPEDLVQIFSRIVGRTTVKTDEMVHGSGH